MTTAADKRGNRGADACAYGNVGSTGAATRDTYSERVDGADWRSVTAEVNEYGGALLPRLLNASEVDDLRALYDDADHVVRATVDMGRHRLGEGQYKYLHTPAGRAAETGATSLPLRRPLWADVSGHIVGREALR